MDMLGWGATLETPGCIWGVLSEEGYLHFSLASQWQGHNFLSRLAQFDVSLDWNVILVLPKSIAETLDFGSVIFFFYHPLPFLPEKNDQLRICCLTPMVHHQASTD